MLLNTTSVDDDFSFSWKKVCIQHEDMDRFWSDPFTSLDFYRLKDQHFAPVDAVHIMAEGRLCISGSRDRTLGVWNLEDLVHPDDAGDVKKSFRQSLDGHKVGK